MKRDFLKNLELEDDVIDKIMAENGKDDSPRARGGDPRSCTLVPASIL
jgi:hypothetical protein